MRAFPRLQRRRRRQQIQKPGRAPRHVRRDEQRTASYARDALERIALPKGRGVLPAWREQQWLDQHLVTITELDHGVLQASLTRVTSRSRSRD